MWHERAWLKSFTFINVYSSCHGSHSAAAQRLVQLHKNCHHSYMFDWGDWSIAGKLIPNLSSRVEKSFSTIRSKCCIFVDCYSDKIETKATFL